MSTPIINQSLFNLTPVKDGLYELSIAFFDGDKQVSSKKFTFIQKKMEEGKYEKHLKDDPLLDVYSQNGMCSPKILSTLFSKKDEQGLKKAEKMRESLGFKGRTILVLDIRDPDKGYADKETIVKCERAVCEFFKDKIPLSDASKHAKKIHKHPMDFVLCEGRLKADLLKHFTPLETRYFETASGRQSLCQCAEFFMNALKGGDIIEGGTLLADKYIESISGRYSFFEPCTTSTVLYPSLYEKMYSLDGAFAKTLSAVFSVSGTFDPSSKITIMNVARK